MPIETYFKDIADAIREKSDTSALITPGNMPQAILDLPSGGGSFITQTEWDALTFAEKQARGLSLIGTEGTVTGQYYDFSNLVGPWYFTEINNVVALFKGTGFNFRCFYSTTAGDRVVAGGRGGTRSSNAFTVICNYRFASPYGYGGFAMFGLSQEALQCTDTQYYSICSVANHSGLYVAGIFDGSWYNNTEVSFTHNATTQNLQNIFSLDEYTIYSFTKNGNVITFDSANDELLNNIYQCLLDNN